MCATQHGYDGEEAIQPDSGNNLPYYRWLTRFCSDLKPIAYRG